MDNNYLPTLTAHIVGSRHNKQNKQKTDDDDDDDDDGDDDDSVMMISIVFTETS